MKHPRSQSRRPSSAPRESASRTVRQLSVDELLEVQAGFGGGLGRESFVIDGGEG